MENAEKTAVHAGAFGGASGRVGQYSGACRRDGPDLVCVNRRLQVIQVHLSQIALAFQSLLLRIGNIDAFKDSLKPNEMQLGRFKVLPTFGLPATNNIPHCYRLGPEVPQF